MEKAERVVILAAPKATSRSFDPSKLQAYYAARGVAAVAQARRNQKAWEPALALWKEARSLAPDNDDYRIGYIKTLADARMDTLALQEAQRLVQHVPAVLDLVFHDAAQAKRTGQHHQCHDAQAQAVVAAGLAG